MDFRRTPKWKRVLGKVALISGSLVAACAIGGWIVQHRRDTSILAAHPAPGEFVDVGSHTLHFRLHGAGEFTFVLEAGLGSYSGSWGPFEKSLAEIGRVFVYDRAGLGWSEEGPQSRTPEQITLELHRAIEVAELPRPLIFVGHSFGGFTQVVYAARYPDDVAGLLLIEPSHQDQMARMPRAPVALMSALAQIARTARFGLPQLLLGSSDPVENQSRHVETSAAEMRAFLEVGDPWHDRSLKLGTTPIYVLTGGQIDRFGLDTEEGNRAAAEIWRGLHADLVAASTSEIRKHEIVAGASHHIHRTHPAAIVNAARELVDRIKAQTLP